MASRDHAPSTCAATPKSAAPKAQIFDFRKGRGTWGHALHGGTWHPIPATETTTGHLWWKKTTRTPDRVSVMIHAQSWPQEGDRLLMSGQSGNDWDLRIVGVEPSGNPSDMFTVTLEQDASERSEESPPRQVSQLIREAQ